MNMTSDNFGLSGAEDYAKRMKQDAAGVARTVRKAGASEMEGFITDVEDLVTGIGDTATPEVKRLKAKVKGALDTAKKAFAHGVDTAQDQASRAFSAGDDYVHEQPWQAIAIAASVGLVIGFLAARR